MKLPKRFMTLLTGGGVLCTVVGGTVLWKDKLAAGSAKKSPQTAAAAGKDQSGKVFIVTGANSGIGKEITHELARLNGRVYMACRDLDKCERIRREIVLDTRNKFVYCRHCDLSNFDSVRRFAVEFGRKEAKLDALVNNAGVMNHPRKYTADGFEQHFQVNHLGHVLLTESLLDQQLTDLGGQRRPRIVFLVNLDYRKADLDFSNLNSDRSWNATEAFRQSQLANMIYVHHLSSRRRRETGEPPIIANGVYPGVVATNIKRYMGVDKSITGNFIANPLLWMLTKSPERGAETPVFVTLDDESNATGKLFSNFGEVSIDSKSAIDDKIAERLLAVDFFWTGLSPSKEQAVKRAKLK